MEKKMETTILSPNNKFDVLDFYGTCFQLPIQCSGFRVRFWDFWFRAWGLGFGD